MKKISLRKYKRKSIWLLSISAIAFATVLLSSCSAIPTDSNVKSLFKPGNQFGDNEVGLNVKDLTSQVLTDDSAFVAFMDSVMGNVLLSFYKNNPLKQLSDKYDDWVKEVDKSWDNEVQTYRDQHRNNYLLNLQIGPLDSNGGTEASWKQTELAKKALLEFQNSIFATDFLNYTNDNGHVVTQVSRDDLLKQNNWSKLKYTNQHTDSKYISNPTNAVDNINNNNQMFADIQDFLATQWVKQENPNLLSRVVLTNETPKVGFSNIFNDKVNPSISPSYEFQVFNPYSDNPAKSPAGLWNLLVGGNNGLNKFLDTSNGTIDIPTEYSMDSGGKLLMNAFDMFDTYDALFSSAYVNQYLNLAIDGYATTNLGQPQEINSQENIMNAFLRKKDSNDKESMYTSLDFAREKESNDTRTFFSDNAKNISNGQYKNYSLLESTDEAQKTYIYDIATQKLTSSINSNASKNDTVVNQFLLSRGSDGVHIMGIDGGKYYITSQSLNNGNGNTNSTTNKSIRDIEKQKQFLLFRSLFKKLNYNEKNKDYSFNSTTQIQTLFNTKPSLFIYEAFENDLNNGNGFLSLASNKNLKDAFENVYNKIKDYVSAMQQNTVLTKIETAIKGMRDKFTERGEKYTENDKQNVSANNGIAGRIPNVQANDGSIPSLEYYYQNLAYENGILDSTNSAFSLPKSNDFSTNPTGTRSYFVNLRNTLNNKISTSAKNLAESLNLTVQTAPTYSQIVLLKSNADDFFTLPINLAINAGISSTNVTNLVKSKYFQNNSSFSNFYDFTTGKIKTSGIFSSIASKIQNITNYFYAENILNSSNANKISYGTINTKTTNGNSDSDKFSSYNNILNNVLEQENFAKNLNSDEAIKYFTYLYTFEWLLRDNLANFKSILNSQIQTGTSALVSWTVPISANPKTALSSSNNPITKFPDNPYYFWGAPTNWMNSVNSPAIPEKSNNLNYPYSATFTSATTGNSTTYSDMKFGFIGLSVQGDKKTNEALDNVLYSQFAKSPEVPTTSNGSGNNIPTGSLFAYGSSRDSVVKYIQNNLNTNRDLDTFINFLVENIGVEISEPSLSPNNTDISTKNAALVTLMNDNSKIPDKAFNRYTGYIGHKKSTTDIAASEPVLSNDFTQLLPTYMSQINIDDVQNLGTNNWMGTSSNITAKNDTNSSGRLGLSIDEFLAVVAIQALDSGSQSSAITNLINTNINADKSVGRTKIGDKRLLDALTSRWGLPINI
ncbi:DUF3713 domain-containing protein [Mycoplasmoides pirum]|uniref:DUF3713 domain-containing protein n=1 Tax=Mycoplasmoides pirum TaxID=2122 RepID=UPI000487C92D|nr:DUF3713 domain-containing protein [Mycoplasmoides pirum]